MPQNPVPPPFCHAVHFFRDDFQLCREVAAFIADGLERGEPGLVVTNPAHRNGIVHELHCRNVDASEAVRTGDLLMLDADATLRTIMAGALPDADAYHQNLQIVLDQLLRGRPGPVRIFGDMVDLLWQRAQFDAAIRIEILSNELAATHPISVICGYSMGQFLKHARRLQEVCAFHGRVHPPDLAVTPNVA